MTARMVKIKHFQDAAAARRNRGLKVKDAGVATDHGNFVCFIQISWYFASSVCLE